MADVATPTPAAPAPKKAKAKTGKPKPKMDHPKTSEMVLAAIKNLKERGGSSVHAIKKYVAANYKVDIDKQTPFIKKYLKSAVASGAIVQTKGKGASGSFKVKATVAAKKEKPAPKVTKPKSASPKKAAVKKTVKKVKKAASPKKPAKAKAPKKEKKAKTPKKPKAPKPKKAASKPKAKKAAPKKK